MRSMKLMSQSPEVVNSEDWPGGKEKVFVSLRSGELLVGFKVYANSEARREGAEMLLGLLHGDRASDIGFSIHQDSESTVLLLNIAGHELELGDVPEEVSEKLLRKHWDEVGKGASLDGFGIDLSVAGHEVDKDRVMRMADDEETLNGMSEREFMEMMSSLRGALMTEVYVVKVYIAIRAAKGDLLLCGGNNGC